MYRLTPFLIARGESPFEAGLAGFIVPIAVLFALAFAWVKWEGVPLTMRAMAARLRLRRPTWQQVGWTVVGLVTAVVLSVVVAPTRNWVLSMPLFQPPASFPPILNPMLQNQEIPAVTAAWMGAEAVGNYGYAALVLLLFFFNSVGEELYWRGVVFPRQELIYGRWTWLVHGLLWNLFHLPIYPWYLIFGLVPTLTISWVAQKTGNTWMVIGLHLMMNLFMTMLMLGVVFQD